MDAQPTSSHHGHDTHAIPPQAICNAYKHYQKMEDAELDQDLEIVDFTRGLTDAQKERIVPVGTVTSSTIAAAQEAFVKFGSESANGRETKPRPCALPEECTVYEHKNFDGLRILPGLLPPECQVLLLSRLLHRDLSNPLHTTNLHSSHHMPYPAPPPSAPSANSHPASFFTLPQSSPSPSALFTPLPTAPPSAKPLNTSQVLHKKLRYLTLGAQYNWATRAYPASPRDSPTTFPADIRALVSTLFPTDPLTRAQFRPESGVVLLYGAKDYMPVHRDVSEECERGLASFSLGCDGLFVVGREKPGAEGGGDAGGEMDVVALRVRSGDVVYMAGETRWAWHAMPRVLAGTCPAWFRDWPMEKERGGEFEKEFKRWRGYMVGKRLNISCRQVWG